jgi:hypothetical protein
VYNSTRMKGSSATVKEMSLTTDPIWGPELVSSLFAKYCYFTRAANLHCLSLSGVTAQATNQDNAADTHCDFFNDHLE